MSDSLLTPVLLRRLEQLQWLARRRSRSPLRGERKSKARGQSVEFADHRNYVAGDDLRYLDWNLFGRLDRFFIKLYEEERELPLTVLLDCSESMNFGTPSKFRFARELAAAFSYVALCGFDRVSVFPLPDTAGERSTIMALSDVRGKPSAPELFLNLARLKTGGSTSFSESLRRIASTARRSGMAILITDLLDPDGYEAGLKSLVSRGWDVLVVHVLAPEELSPEEFGELRLVDSETGTVQEVTFAKHRLEAYRSTVQEFCSQARDCCRKQDVAYVLVSSATNIDQVLLKDLRSVGVWS
ncbi:MAG TPA: DUF58 domain-containing protein [Roseimicrobium sp.]|nr:DUF58 domain-containing protein [Roseimicrobium sp.]